MQLLPWVNPPHLQRYLHLVTTVSLTSIVCVSHVCPNVVIRAIVGVEMCPPRWIQYEKRCYLDATERRTWIDAESECTRDGGHLISFHSATDHQSVVKNRDVWVGLNDLEVEGRYRWSDGSPLNYVNFYQRHTNGVDSQQTDCFVSRNGAWELRKCDERHQFICWQPVILGN